MKPFKNRLSVFISHLGLSALIAIMAIALVFFVWYPTPLHEAQGVTKIFLLLLTVDIIIGPILSFITYKPTLGFVKHDLPIIVLIQVIALGYGVYTVFQARPAYLVFNRDRFTIVRTLDINPDSLAVARKNKNPSAEASLFTPRWVAAIPPTDSKRLAEVMFSKEDWNQLPESFASLAQAKDKIVAKAHSLQELRDLYKENMNVLYELNAWQSTVKWLPLMTAMKDMIVLIHADSGEVITILNIDPWKKPTA